jgi:para-nitrobenzyl esterase
VINLKVEVDGGAIQGVELLNGRCVAFKGVPFAEPPVGHLRWRTPQPVKAWTGVRPADRFGNAPIQPLLAGDSIMRMFSFAQPPESGVSEDCLYLNVWSGAQSARERLPVIVWIFGGGHRVGSASHPVADGAALAAKGAVVVSVNYRLGALGYLAHPALTKESGSSGNFASMDLIAGLEWVQRNIGGFGGDPRCVTVFGQSAGAAHVNVLAASPLARGLFHRAIVHSSGRFAGGPMGAPMKTLEQAEQSGAALLRDLGATTLEQIRDLPADVMAGPRGFWNPIVDGVVLKHSVQVTFDRGEAIKIPVLAGYTSGEAAPYPQHDLHTVQGLRDFAITSYGKDASRFLALYPHETNEQAAQSSYWLRRDTAFAYQPWRYACLAAHAGEQDVYMFNFRQELPIPAAHCFHEPKPPSGYGAFHGSELWYVFNNLSALPWPVSVQDIALAELMSSAWLNFARDGKPGTLEGAHWSAFSADHPVAMQFGREVGTGPLLNQAALEFHYEHFHR